MSKINKGLMTSNTDLWATPQDFFDQQNGLYELRKNLRNRLKVSTSTKNVTGQQVAFSAKLACQVRRL